MEERQSCWMNHDESSSLHEISILSLLLYKVMMSNSIFSILFLQGHHTSTHLHHISDRHLQVVASGVDCPAVGGRAPADRPSTIGAPFAAKGARVDVTPRRWSRFVKLVGAVGSDVSQPMDSHDGLLSSTHRWSLPQVTVNENTDVLRPPVAASSALGRRESGAASCRSGDRI